jgi:hypothetical protein
MLREAVRDPIPLGVNVTLMVQFPPAATLDPQVLVWLKSDRFVPVKLKPLMFSAAVPVLLRVTTWAGLEVPTSWVLKVRLLGARETAAAPPP